MSEYAMMKDYDGIYVKSNVEISDEEAKAYIERGLGFHGKNLYGMILDIKGDTVDIRYDIETRKFERIRRITGYLVGTVDRWNDAKTAELKDRVKHGI